MADRTRVHVRRSDAQRNRDHILQVAHDAFAESGTTSLNEIAKRAGVGPGTLYRHFPTREALILAVYRRDMQRLVDSVPDVLAIHPPLDAFRFWFHTLAEYVRVKHGLGEALRSGGDEGCDQRNLCTGRDCRRQADRCLRGLRGHATGPGAR